MNNVSKAIIAIAALCCFLGAFGVSVGNALLFPFGVGLYLIAKLIDK